MTNLCDYCGENEGCIDSRFCLNEHHEGYWVCAMCEEELQERAAGLDHQCDICKKHYDDLSFLQWYAKESFGDVYMCLDCFNSPDGQGFQGVES